MLFHDLPEDVLLLLADPESGYMHWTAAVQLSLTSSRLRALIVAFRTKNGESDSLAMASANPWSTKVAAGAHWLKH